MHKIVRMKCYAKNVCMASVRIHVCVGGVGEVKRKFDMKSSEHCVRYIVG